MNIKTHIISVIDIQTIDNVSFVSQKLLKFMKFIP